MIGKKNNWFSVDEDVFDFADLPANAPDAGFATGLETGVVAVFDAGVQEPVAFAGEVTVPGVDASGRHFVTHGNQQPPVFLDVDALLL
jgi:hypothetical protein